MDKFLNYLDIIQQLTKERKFNKAWGVANKALLDLLKEKDDMWFMMYYQMAIILARERKWQNALEKMGYMIHYAGGIGGVTHEKFILRLLKKFNKENELDKYIELAKKENPEKFGKELSNLINN